MNKTWPTKKLGEVCDLVRGSEPGSTAYIKESTDTIPFLRVGDLSGKVNKQKFISKKSKNILIINPREILITFDGTPGIVTKGLYGAISSGIRVVRNIKQDEILKDFLFYYLQTPPVQETIRFYTTGATISHASRSIPHIKIKIPPLSIQQKIVERLDAIRKAQELNKKQISLANELFQSLLHQELNPEEKNWEVKKLRKISLVITKGTTPTTYGYQFTKSGLPFLRAENINNDEVDFRKTEHHISKNTHEFLNRSKTKPHDILVTIAGTIGRIAYVPKDAPEMNMNQAVAIVRLKLGVNPLYIFYLLQTKTLQRKMKGSEVTATVTNISLTTLRNLRIFLPPFETQQKIVGKLSAVQEYKKKLLIQKKLLQELFEATLDKAMKGELVK